MTLPGNVKDIFDKLCECEFFVLSSNYEGMPNALIEAMGLGVPIISTKVSGATDLVQDGINGLLVNVNDDNGLYDSMIKLAESEELRRDLGLEAVKIADLLNSKNICDRWEKTISDVLRK